MIDPDIREHLSVALREKRLNKAAHDEITKWLSESEFEEFVPELAQRIKEGDWEQLMDAFYRVVIFGTGGIRGVMEIGTNRINNYTIRWASQAYANYLRKHEPERMKKGIAIAYDSRLNSEQFMKETARVLSANGVPVRIFKYYRATPELSFAVRHLDLAGGIVITASHNPPEFNGYKLYNEAGVQLLPDVGLQIEAEFKLINEIKKETFEAALAADRITYIDDEVDRAFAEVARSVSLSTNRNVRIVYSPLHGVGSQSVLPVLRAIGFNDITVVKEQESLDGNFPNVEGHFPNPEFAVCYEQSIALAKEVHADIVIVSDPDADRLGLAVPDKDGNWTNLTGNQGAVLLGHYYLNQLKEKGDLPTNPVVIKTSVTTELVRDVAESYGAEVIGDLLVGFKFICDRQDHLPPEKHFVFACEESVGYLFSDAYRDKGADTPAVVAAEMAAWCRAQGKAPMDLLESIYERYGYYAERLYYKLLEGFGAFDRQNLAMVKLRSQLPKHIGKWKVIKVLDRLTGEVRDGQTGELLETRDWDKGDMVSFFLSDDERNAIHVRPSATEPKMKYYTMIKGSLSDSTKADIDAEAKEAEGEIARLLEGIINSITVDVF